MIKRIWILPAPLHVNVCDWVVVPRCSHLQLWLQNTSSGEAHRWETHEHPADKHTQLIIYDCSCTDFSGKKIWININPWCKFFCILISWYATHIRSVKHPIVFSVVSIWTLCKLGQHSLVDVWSYLFIWTWIENLILKIYNMTACAIKQPDLNSDKKSNI